MGLASRLLVREAGAEMVSGAGSPSAKVEAEAEMGYGSA